MDISAISEQTETEYTFSIANESVLWNGRDVQELRGLGFPAIMHTFSTKQETHRSLDNCRIHVAPKMSRAADESKAEIKGGYDEDRGVFVEGSWTWTWKDHDDKNTSSSDNAGTSLSDPPDSRDRDFDKDVNNN
ncbi:MAG: hypothetical protein V4487_01105 [Chlamydiota bacterium]